MSTHIERGYTWHETEIATWGGKILIVITADGRAYYPLPPLCRIFGLNAQSQSRRLRGSRVYGKHVEQFRLPTSGGDQLIYCLERRALGLFLGSVEDQILKGPAADFIVEYQELLMLRADELLNGVVESTPPVDGDLTALQTWRFESNERFLRMLARRVGQIELRLGTLEADDGERGDE